MDQTLIEQIVAEVMSRLVTGDESAPTAETKHTEPKTQHGTSVSFSDRVITEDILNDNVNGHGFIRIAPGAILTPSAGDWLRGRKVEVIRDDTKTQTTGTARWLAIVHSGSLAVSSVLDDAGRTVTLNTKSVATAAAAARTAVLDLRSSDAHGVVVFSSESETVACLANREACCRAGVVRTVADVRRVQNSMGCNLFAVNADGLGFFELRNLLQSAASGIPTAPQEWK